jgi:hypothetical protein
VAIGQQSFAIRQQFGDWAEDTVLGYFSSHHETQIVAVPYGERWAGKRKATPTDAVYRPDLLLLKRDAVRSLAENDINIDRLSLRTLSDSDPQMRAILREAMVAFEVKISFRFYAKGHVNFIVDELRKERYETWLSKTKGIGDVVAWLTLDKAFITPMDRVLSEGEEIERTYEARGAKARTKMTYNLPVEEAIPFADVTGVRLNETIRASLSRGSSGSVAFSIEHKPGSLENVNLKALSQMADDVRRSSGK